MQDFVERGGTSNEKAIACLGRQVATGLKHVHGKGYAHRDVKPSNILLERSGIAKLADFGIASKCDNEASTRTFVGTAQYMSPERIRGDAYTTAADVWGLGVSLLAVVRGSAPFGSKNENEDADDALQAICMSEPLCAPLLLTCFGAPDTSAAPYVYVKCTSCTF